ncbi:MAG TPA: histidinol-phosphate transaminase [Phenylobacterium sp.]
MTQPLAPDDRALAPRPTPKPGILDIAQYVPGKSQAEGVVDPIKLSGNENILGSSPKARLAYASAIDKLHLYPDGRAGVLREAVSRQFNLPPENLVFGCGSDELLHLIAQVFLEPGDNIVQAEYAFGAYGIAARACQADVRNVPEPNFRIDVDAMAEQVDARTRLIFITNPANPTGTFVTGEELRRLQGAVPPSVAIVVDAAYCEFADDPTFDTGLELAQQVENVIVTRTFSKLHGLAALRVGWAYAPEPIIDAIERIRAPFNVNIPAQLAAVASLGDGEFQQQSIALVRQWRPWLTQQLGGLGLELTPSQANFILVGFPPGKSAAQAEAFLAARGLIVRGLAGYGLPNHLRLTIGLEAHNRAMVDALADFLRA